MPRDYEPLQKDPTGNAPITRGEIQFGLNSLNDDGQIQITNKDIDNLGLTLIGKQTVELMEADQDMISISIIWMMVGFVIAKERYGKDKNNLVILP
jgi:hypothetical protein